MHAKAVQALTLERDNLCLRITEVREGMCQEEVFDSCGCNVWDLGSLGFRSSVGYRSQVEVLPKERRAPSGHSKTPRSPAPWLSGIRERPRLCALAWPTK